MPYPLTKPDNTRQTNGDKWALLKAVISPEEKKWLNRLDKNKCGGLQTAAQFNITGR